MDWSADNTREQQLQRKKKRAMLEKTPSKYTSLSVFVTQQQSSPLLMWGGWTWQTSRLICSPRPPLHSAPVANDRLPQVEKILPEKVFFLVTPTLKNSCFPINDIHYYIFVSVMSVTFNTTYVGL